MGGAQRAERAREDDGRGRARVRGAADDRGDASASTSICMVCSSRCTRVWWMFDWSIVMMVECELAVSAAVAGHGGHGPFGFVRQRLAGASAVPIALTRTPSFFGFLWIFTCHGSPSCRPSIPTQSKDAPSSRTHEHASVSKAHLHRHAAERWRSKDQQRNSRAQRKERSKTVEKKLCVQKREQNRWRTSERGANGGSRKWLRQEGKGGGASGGNEEQSRRAGRGVDTTRRCWMGANPATAAARAARGCGDESGWADGWMGGGECARPA